MKTQRVRFAGLMIFLLILLGFIFSTSLASTAQAGQMHAFISSPLPPGGAAKVFAQPAGSSSCTRLFKSDEVPTPELINFDDLAAGTVIGTQYKTAHGVVFVYTDTTTAVIQDNTAAPSAPNAAANLPVVRLK